MAKTGINKLSIYEYRHYRHEARAGERIAFSLLLKDLFLILNANQVFINNISHSVVTKMKGTECNNKYFELIELKGATLTTCYLR